VCARARVRMTTSRHEVLAMSLICP
jgi:hypothetical protein